MKFKRGMPPHRDSLMLVGLLLFLLLLGGCHPAEVETRSYGGFSDGYAGAVLELCQDRVKTGEIVAVSAFYDGDNGDFTALGDQWRDRAEAALAVLQASTGWSDVVLPYRVGRGCD